MIDKHLGGGATISHGRCAPWRTSMATLNTDINAPPTPPRRTTRERSRAKRATLWSLGGLAAVVVLALAVTALLDARDERRNPPGELIELADGRMLHLQVSGLQHSGPTVVLDAGQGLFSPAFAWLQQELARHVTVVAYDRPGYGWSTHADRPVDAGATVDDLHEALASSSLEGPYLLVGHSLGAFYVRTFAVRYPEQTLGIVLLDPAHEQQFDRLPADAIAEFESAGQVFRWAAHLARLGVFRLSNPQQRATTDLPDAAAREIVTVSAMARYWQTAGAEVDAFDKLAATPPHDLGDLPVMIVSSGRDVPDRPQTRDAMDDLDRELASRTPQAIHHIIDGADHLTMLTVDEHARAVSSHILELLRQAPER
jgi:pimeloyl-ACP methyl ester carboxylesterase